MTFVVSAVVIGGAYVANEIGLFGGGGDGGMSEAERQQKIREAEKAKELEYQGLADKYNEQVGTYNTGVSNQVSGLTGLGQNIEGLTAASLWDDPNTAANENQFSNYMGQLNNMETGLANMSFDATKPTFSNTIETEWGTGNVNIPTLNELSDYSGFSSTIDELQGTLTGLQDERDTLTKEFDAFQNNLDFDLGQINKNIGGLGMGDTSTLGLYENELDLLGKRVADFDNPLSQQLGGITYNDQPTRNLITGLNNQRVGEESRISQEKTNITNNMRELQGALGGNQDYDFFNMMIGRRVGDSMDQTGVGYDARFDLNSDGKISLNDITELNEGYMARAGGGQGSDQFENLLGLYANPLDITDFDRLNELQGQYNTALMRPTNFESDLGFDFSSQLAGLKGVGGDIDQLLQDRIAEQGRIDTQRGIYEDEALGFKRYGENLGIGDETDITNLGYNLEDLRSDMEGFSSKLDFNFDDAFSDLGLAETGLEGLKGARDAELGRISSFGDALGEDAITYGSDLSGYNIANIDEMNALQELIDARQLEADRFESELDFDFKNQLEDISGVEGDLGQLFLDRDLELGRISEAEKSNLATANALDKLADDTDIYSKAGIDALQSELDTLNQDITGFESLLDFDFSGSEAARGQAQTDIDALLADRSAALDVISDPISGIGEDAAGLELYDEAGMLDQRDLLTGLSSDLSDFSGGRVGDIQANIDTEIGNIDGRITELNEYRDTLEENAQALMEQIQNASYYAVGDLSGDQSAFDTQQAEIDLYNAQQALDELNTMEQRLLGERNRLEQDAQNVLARTGAAQSAVNLDEFGNPVFAAGARVQPMYENQRMALLSSSDDEEDFTLNPNAFGSNVIRYG